MGTAVEYVTNYRTESGTYPTPKGVRLATGCKPSVSYEAIRRVRLDFNEVIEAGTTRTLMADAEAYTLAYYRQHGVLPTNTAVANAIGCAIASANSARAKARKVLGSEYKRPQKEYAPEIVNERRAAIVATFERIRGEYPQLSSNHIMVMTGSVMGVSRQRVHQIMTDSK